MKLGLGTVQLGLDYGASNDLGRPTRDEVRLILAEAAASGISVLDTAPAYGTSEERIGSLRPAEQRHFQIITKTPVRSADTVEESVGKKIAAGLRESLRRLRVASVRGLLVHRPGDLLGDMGPAIWRALCDLREAGLVEKIGVSVYSAWEVDEILERYPVDLIQVPVSVFDQRLVVSGHLERLKERSIEVHARSVFLQGVLLMEPARLPEELSAMGPDLERFRRHAATLEVTPLCLALGFVHALEEVDVVLCGVASLSQLIEIIEALETEVDPVALRGLAVQHPVLLDPSTWSQSGGSEVTV